MTEIEVATGRCSPPREDDRDRAGEVADLAGEQRSDADSARALDHELRALEQEDDPPR